MSRFLEAGAAALALALIAGPASAATFGLGRPATADEIAAWDIDVRPDGVGLPEGSGDVTTGEEIFTDRCAVCHGDFGEAVGRWPVLAGGQGTLSDDRPNKTIGSFWPYLSTVYDNVHRAMPFGDAQSLTPDETYAITAYLLYLNDIVDDEEFVLSRENFLEVEMPNADGFMPDDRMETEFPVFVKADVCMENCKDTVEITGRAAILDVTPEETRARQLKEAVDKAKSGTAADAVTVESAPPVSLEGGPAGDTAPAEQVAAAETAPAETVEPAPAETAAPDPQLVAAGEKVFKKCQACHQVGEDAKNRSGPQLNGIVGRTAGTVDGFKYSNPMAEAGANGLVWDHAELSGFLTKPRDYMKGTKMSFAGLKDQADIDAVVAYLSTFAAD